MWWFSFYLLVGLAVSWFCVLWVARELMRLEGADDVEQLDGPDVFFLGMSWVVSVLAWPLMVLLFVGGFLMRIVLKVMVR